MSTFSKFLNFLGSGHAKKIPDRSNFNIKFDEIKDLVIVAPHSEISSKPETNYAISNHVGATNNDVPSNNSIVAAPTAILFCVHCGNKSANGDAFCMNCGQKL